MVSTPATARSTRNTPSPSKAMKNGKKGKKNQLVEEPDCDKPTPVSFVYNPCFLYRLQDSIIFHDPKIRTCAGGATQPQNRHGKRLSCNVLSNSNPGPSGRVHTLAHPDGSTPFYTSVSFVNIS